MVKYCPSCGRKLGVFSESQVIVENDEEKELCELCYQNWRKKTLKNMKQTPDGRMELFEMGSILIRRGLFWFIGGIILNALILFFIVYSEVPFAVIFWGVVIYGLYDIFKGIYYKLRYKPRRESKI